MTESTCALPTVLVAGAGAIGGTLAARLAAAGARVDLLARGRTLAALRADGLRLDDLDGHWQVPAATTGEPAAAADGAPLRVIASAAEARAPDLLLLASKSQDLAGLVAAAAPAIAAHTLVLPLVNGVPFWYFHGHGGRFDGQPVRAVDPEGALLRALPMDRVLGAVVFVTAESDGPGRLRSQTPHLLMLGEPDTTAHPPADGPSARLQRVCGWLQAAGIGCRALPRLRDKLWTKLIANLTSNPLSVLTGATLRRIYSEPALLDTVHAVMHEVMLTAAAYGARLEIDPIEFVRLGAGMGEFRTSMLQDVERGRPLELAAIGDAVVELAERYGLPVPATRRLLLQTRWHAEQRAAACPATYPATCTT
ncbi:MAG: hypothetical protein RL223_1712 [Pseudomonadota bacterium]|jgi:2-dehydropantoate 2-reductase